MKLRAWTLLWVLALAPAAEAAGGLFHLCHGRVQLDLTCCCHHDGQPQDVLPPGHGVHDVNAGKAADRCCADVRYRAASPEPVPAAAHLSSSWRGALAIPPGPAHPPLAPPAATAARDTRIRAQVPPSTAPPLFLQHCSYLI